MKKITKGLMTLALLCVAGVMSAAEYEVDQKFTSVADLDGQFFMIVNETDGKAIFNSGNQNLDYQDYATAVTGAAYLWKINAVTGQSYYTVQAVKADGSNPSFWGNGNPKYLNAGAPGGFNGCFILENGTQQGTDFPNGGVWYIEYSDGNGFALKNVGRDGYLAAVNAAPTGTDPVYWTFCTIKEKAVEDTEDPGVKECPADWTNILVNGTLSGTETDNYVVEVGNGKETATITEDAGRLKGAGIKVTSKAGASNNYDTQFFLVAPEALEPGTKLHIEFDYKASQAAKITTQAHSAPGSFISNNGIGDVNCGLSWEHFEKEIIVKDEGTTCIAFNLNENLTDAIDFYFDNFVMWKKANAITKPERAATDALVISFDDFEAADWDAEAKTFTGNGKFDWGEEDGLDLSQYRYLIVTTAKNLCVGGYEVSIKDKNGKTIRGDQYGADYMNMWFGQWNNHNCLKIDLEKLRVEQEFDIYHITELTIPGQDGFILGNVYATNQKPNNDKNWGNEDSGDFNVSGVAVDKFGTICLPYQAAVAGAYVYEIASVSETGVSLAQYDGLLEAGKAYIYKTNASNDAGNAPAAVRFYKATATEETDPIANNGLVGTFTETTAPTGSLVLSNNALYTVDSDVTIGANKAWIDPAAVTSSTSRGTVFLSFGEVTGIKAANVVETLNDSKVFDLQGREVAQPKKGVYLVSGKKVVIK